MKSAIGLLVLVVIGGLVSNACAQAVTPPTSTVPGQNLTPDQTKQLQQLMMLRALQLSGRHQVKTGYPQVIGGGLPSLDPQVAASTDSSATGIGTPSSSSQKRADARLQREQQKQAKHRDAKATKTSKSKTDKKTGKSSKSKDAKPVEVPPT